MLTDIQQVGADKKGALPSVGTEAATAHSFGELARQGHYGLLVVTDDAKTAERLMAVVRRVPFSAAQRYRQWVIEELN